MLEMRINADIEQRYSGVFVYLMRPIRGCSGSMDGVRYNTRLFHDK